MFLPPELVGDSGTLTLVIQIRLNDEEALRLEMYPCHSYALWSPLTLWTEPWVTRLLGRQEISPKSAERSQVCILYIFVLIY